MCHSEQTNVETPQTPATPPNPAPAPPGPSHELYELRADEIRAVQDALLIAAIRLERGRLYGSAAGRRALASRFANARVAFLFSAAGPQGVGESAADRRGADTPPAERPGPGGLCDGLPERDLAVTPAEAPTLMRAAERALYLIRDLKGGAVYTTAAVQDVVRFIDAALDACGCAPGGGLWTPLTDARYALRLLVAGKITASEIVADAALARAGASVPTPPPQPLAKLGQGEYAREVAEPEGNVRRCCVCRSTSNLTRLDVGENGTAWYCQACGGTENAGGAQ